MRTVVVRVGALLAATAALAVGDVPQALAAEEGPSFRQVHTLPFWVDALASPDADTVVAAGRDADWNAVVATRTAGTWRTQNLGRKTSTVQAMADGGMVYVLMGAGSSVFSLWQSVGDRFVEVPSPTIPLPDGGFFIATSMAVDDQTLVVAGNIQVPDRWGHRHEPRVAVRRHGVWSVVTPNTPQCQVNVLGAKHGRMVLDLPVWSTTRANEPVFDSYVFNAPTDGAAAAGGLPLTWLGQTSHGDISGSSSFGYPSGSLSYLPPPPAAVRTAWDFTVWGGYYDRTTHRYTRGLCKTFVNGDASACPAPRWPVTHAAATVDGRTVVGGSGSRHVGYDDFDPSLAGFGLVGRDGQVVPMPGDATALRALTTSQIGAHAWAATSAGQRPFTSTILEADVR